MATIIIDDPDAHEAGNQVASRPNQAEVVNAEAAPAPEATPPAAEEEIPEKFRGKKLNDILKSYEEMEKVVGRQGAELGELRKTHDEFIRSALGKTSSNPANPAPSQEPSDDTEFFVNPKAAIAKAIAEHPDVVEARRLKAAAEAERAFRALEKRHSDVSELIQEGSDFISFVRENPVLGQLMRDADANNDVDKADFVIRQYKATRNAAPQPTATPAQPATRAATEAARRDAVEASKVPSGASAPVSEGAQKTYKRTELIRKMQRDPEWYAANADEILLAYQEGRVK